MTAHSNILVWRIPWTEEPGGLQSWASLVAQLVKNPPAMWETWIRSLDWEDPLEKEQANHSSILAWRIPWTIQSMELQRVGHDLATFTFTFKQLGQSVRLDNKDFFCLRDISLIYI